MNIITNINDLDLNGSYSYADYLTWQFKERLELLRGKIFKMSPAPGSTHQILQSNLNGLFWAEFRNEKCKVYPAPFDVRLVKTKTLDEKVTTVVQPDICIVCDTNKLDAKGCNGAPDLIVEIISPGNSQKEMSIKFDLYEENGVLEYWIVDPTEKAVFMYVSQNGKFIGLKPFTSKEKIKSSLFPSLEIEGKTLFNY